MRKSTVLVQSDIGGRLPKILIRGERQESAFHCAPDPVDTDKDELNRKVSHFWPPQRRSYDESVNGQDIRTWPFSASWFSHEILADAAEKGNHFMSSRPSHG